MEIKKMTPEVRERVQAKERQDKALKTKERMKQDLARRGLPSGTREVAAISNAMLAKMTKS